MIQERDRQTPTRLAQPDVVTTSKDSSIGDIDTGLVAHTRPPAKLNLFLELLARRDDGFHEIDTVMVPIDWCDDLRLTRRHDSGIKLSVDWIPSTAEIAAELGVELGSESGDSLLSIPSDQSNLVHRALSQFSEEFGIEGGFECQLGKSIPAGAGMGGASSDAASALRCAATLCDVDLGDSRLARIAAEIGSDVPFFLGQCGTPSKQIGAARATGRGEKIAPLSVSEPIHFVVLFPAVTASTSLVYAESHVPRSPRTSSQLITALESDKQESLHSLLFNRLTVPAKKIAPEIDEILESMWRTGLKTCQLTGSGSACFAIVGSSKDATALVTQFQTEIRDLRAGKLVKSHLGVRAKAARSVSVPTEIELARRTH